MIVRTLNRHWFERPWSALSLASQGNHFDALRDELQQLLLAADRKADVGCCNTHEAASEFELSDEGSQLKLSARLPGLTEKDIDIQLTADNLVLRAERKVTGPDGFNARRRERKSFTFERSYRIPLKIDVDKVEASLVHGVLTVVLPKSAAATPRSIAVRSS